MEQTGNRQKNGILYFSSTGNSLFIAKEVQKRFGGDVIYIPTYCGNGGEFEKIFLVTPIYSFGMPAHVYKLLPKLDQTAELIVIQNYGGMAGGADRLIYRYARRFGLNVKSVYTLKMPENYTLTFTVPKFYIKSTLKKAERRLNDIFARIENKQYALPTGTKTKEKLYLKNMANWHLIGERFSVTENCVLCKKCLTVCPSGNIEFSEGKIVFGSRCVACLGCYHRCPQKAIVYNEKRKKDRYVNPDVTESEIGKNL